MFAPESEMPKLIESWSVFRLNGRNHESEIAPERFQYLALCLTYLLRHLHRNEKLTMKTSLSQNHLWIWILAG